MGIVLGLTFVLAVVRILWWMLHPPRRVAPAGAGAAVETVPQVLVGIQASPLSDQLLRLACTLARAENLVLSAIYVIEVPMTLPLDVEIPGRVKEAEEALAHAREVAEACGIPARAFIRRARKAGRAIVEIASATPTRAIILGARERPRFEDRLFGSTVDFVVRHAPADVLIEKAAPGTRGRGAAGGRNQA